MQKILYKTTFLLILITNIEVIKIATSFLEYCLS